MLFSIRFVLRSLNFNHTLVVCQHLLKNKFILFYFAQTKLVLHYRLQFWKPPNEVNMAIEDTLSSIDTSLKLIVTILQSAGAMSAQSPATTASVATETVAEKKTRTRKDNSTNADPAAAMGLVAGDPEGTRYWVSETLRTVYAQNPGDVDPTDQSFKIETAAHYSAKKEEFAKKNAQATATQTTAAATTPVKTTPDVSTASGAPDWKSVLGAIQALNKSTEPGHGRDGVLAVLTHFGLAGQKVPALEGLNKHAEILAFVNKMLTPADDSDSDLGI